MISETYDCFPNNIVKLLGEAMALVDEDCVIVKRPVQTTDQDQTIAIVAYDWQPDLNSKEIAGVHPGEPTVQIYKLAIQGLIADMDEEAGLMRHSAMAKLIRDILYKNQPIRIALSKLEVLDLQGRWLEKALSWNIDNQQFQNNDANGSFLFLSTLELSFKTQVRT